MTRSSPIRLLLLLRRRQQHSPRPRAPGLCFPKRASQACGHQASALAASPRAAWQPLASSGAPACPPSPRPTLLTARRVTPAGQLTVSPLHTNLLTPVLPFMRFESYCTFRFSSMYWYLFVNPNGTFTNT